ncbi:MAG TPA: hypothetical protein ENI26_08290 [Methylophaga aminisulfidivorans]|uniref:N-acetyltransferase n=2 Tax=root TaxID=1 RepID=A0A7C1W5J0_9GAMM|nr:hypothetical protein [Methylophaga sp.]HEC74356.1 hypothetical protein [Methylophaga aminisulfidivorans]
MAIKSFDHLNLYFEMSQSDNAIDHGVVALMQAEDILAAITFSEVSGIWRVQKSASKKDSGYGPTIYKILMSFACERGISGISPVSCRANKEGQTNARAQKIWMGFAKDPKVNRKALPNELPNPDLNFKYFITEEGVSSRNGKNRTLRPLQCS